MERQEWQKKQGPSCGHVGFCFQVTGKTFLSSILPSRNIKRCNKKFYNAKEKQYGEMAKNLHKELN